MHSSGPNSADLISGIRKSRAGIRKSQAGIRKSRAHIRKSRASIPKVSGRHSKVSGRHIPKVSGRHPESLCDPVRYTYTPQIQVLILCVVKPATLTDDPACRNSYETIPQLLQTIPQQTIPQQTIPQLLQTIPQLLQTIPQLLQTFPQLLQTIPQLLQTTPQRLQTTTHAPLCSVLSMHHIRPALGVPAHLLHTRCISRTPDASLARSARLSHARRVSRNIQDASLAH